MTPNLSKTTSYHVYPRHSIWVSLSVFFTAIFIILFSIEPSFAAGGGGGGSGQTLGDLANQIVTSMSGVVKLITAVSYVAGMGFAMAGIIKFKAHRDAPQQTPLSQPIVLLVVGAALLFLPSILTTAGATIFGQGAANAGSTSGFCNINGQGSCQ